MRRREFITLLGGTAVWPLAARAQQGGPMRRVGALMPGSETDMEEQSRVTAFQQGLAKVGWMNGRNVRIDYRWGALDSDRLGAFAIELVGLRPDVLFAGNTTALAALHRATRSIPIVFALVADPIGGGFCSPSGGRDCHERHLCNAGGKGGDIDYSDRLPGRNRPG